MDRARMRDLIEALLERQPILAGDPTFLRRALVVEGVETIISPRVLEWFFEQHGEVLATVLLRDAARGERVGMLVGTAEQAEFHRRGIPADDSPAISGGRRPRGPSLAVPAAEDVAEEHGDA
ncbi:hypothetical protein E2562_013255 [Oryza meyeriana var. granulata]|uniref:Uncharacterized protein n=1 Tax=Oryza meyeriana var. granulata TaxID=110450 RepID=A0A6G1D383_9ORYZ|nr:hypothetical protein E2562_013255 [Oryza meyeriana var. granulata]